MPCGDRDGNPAIEWTHGGAPYEDWSAYDAQSSMRAVAGVSTPTLFITGGNDGLCPVDLRWMYSALRRQGVRSELLLYRDEGHVLTKPPNQRDLLERVTAWFAEHQTRPPDLTTKLDASAVRAAERHFGAAITAETQSKIRRGQ